MATRCSPSPSTVPHSTLDICLHPVVVPTPRRTPTGSLIITSEGRRDVFDEVDTNAFRRRHCGSRVVHGASMVWRQMTTNGMCALVRRQSSPPIPGSS